MYCVYIRNTQKTNKKGNNSIKNQIWPKKYYTGTSPKMCGQYREGKISSTFSVSGACKLS
jgi:hypothetical protein